MESSGHSPISPRDNRLVVRYCFKEAFKTSDQVEAAAEVVLQDDPPGTKFVASLY